MIDIVFDMSRLENKLFISLLILIVFSVLYLTIPKDELGFDNNDMMTTLFNSLIVQTGFRSTITPKSNRAKIIISAHVILSYCILLLR
jgi:hypothetical protein